MKETLHKTKDEEEDEQYPKLHSIAGCFVIKAWPLISLPGRSKVICFLTLPFKVRSEWLFLLRQTDGGCHITCWTGFGFNASTGRIYRGLKPAECGGNQSAT